MNNNNPFKKVFISRALWGSGGVMSLAAIFYLSSYVQESTLQEDSPVIKALIVALLAMLLLTTAYFTDKRL